jgi:hypothetical protein
VGCGASDWNNLDRDKDHWMVVVNTILNLRILQNWEILE